MSANVVYVYVSIDSEQAFLAAASAVDDVAFAISTNADVAKEFGADVPSITLFKKFDEGRNDYSGAFTPDAIIEFVSGNALPLVVAFSQEVR